METSHIKQEIEPDMYGTVAERILYKLVSNHGSTFPHELFLLPNKQNHLNVDDVNQLYKPFSYKSSYPKPICSTANHLTYDSNMKYVDDKKTWLNKVKLFKQYYKCYKNYRKIQLITKKKSKAIVPLYLYNFTKLLRLDPDPYFDSHYNWYYGGSGNLCLISIRDELFLINSIDDTVYVRKYRDNFENEFVFKHTIINKELIHETICETISGIIFVALRQKHRIYLMQLLHTQCDVSLKPYKTIQTDTPFTSFTMDDVTHSIFYSCADGSVHAYDLESEKYMEILSVNHSTKPVNFWSSVQNFDTNLIHTDSNSISILDKRKCNAVEKYKFSSALDCENYSVSKLSIARNSNLFAATTHSVYLYDLRFINETNHLLNIWSHGLHAVPIFMHNAISESEELLNVCGQLSREQCVIVNSYSSETDQNLNEDLSASTFFIPWQPHSVVDSFKKIQLKGLCLDPTLKIKNRINMSRSGCVFKHMNNQLCLLTLNSLGDIFSQTLFTDEDVDSEEGLNDCFTSWSEQCSMERQQYLPASVVNMTPYWDTMKAQTRPRISTKKSDKLMTSTRCWKEAILNFYQCTDLCARELLDMWELNNEDIGNNDNIAPVDTKFKITNWLDTIPE